MLVEKYGWAIEKSSFGETNQYSTFSDTRKNSKMFNITSKYFSFFNNKPSASWVAYITRDFLACYSCWYYSSLCEHCLSFYQEIAVATNTRKRFSTFKKEEIRNYYASCRDYWETARAFKLQDFTVRKICKASPPETSKYGGLTGRKAWKGNA